MLKHNNRTSKKPESPPSHKSVTNKRARMKCQRRKTVLTASKLVSDGQGVIDWGCTVEGSNLRRAGPTSRDHRGQRAHGREWEPMGVEGPGGDGGAGRRTGWTPGATCGQGRPGAPACAPRPSRPRRPSAGPGPGSDRGQSARAGRGEEAASCPTPQGRGTWPGSRGPGVAWAARSSPLNPRGLGWRLCDGGAVRPAGRRPYPGPHHPAPGPLTSPSLHPQPPQSQEPVRHGRWAPGPEPPASMRSRLGPKGARPGSATCVQQVPARGPAPDALPSPSHNVPPSLRRGHAP